MENEEDETEIQCDTDTPTTSDACVMDTDGSKRNHNRRKRPLKDKDKKTRSTIDSSSQEISKRTCSVFEYVGDVVRDLETTRSPNSFGLQVQQQAPFFEGIAVLKKEFVKVSLNDYKGRYLVLFFYPLDFTFVCPTEIIAFSDRIAEFRDINCDIIGCSTDSQYAHLAWTKMDREDGGLGDLNFPLLSDKDMSISRSYAVLDERTGIPFRGLFIIDGTQTLRQIIVNDLPIGRSVDEVLRLVQALQFHEQNGEVCPINWKPGDRTIKPDPRGSLEYFQSN